MLNEFIFGGAPHRGDLFIYLNEAWHADAWVKGGSIPLSKASAYFADAQDGIMTPDELQQYRSMGIPGDVSSFVDLSQGGSVWVTDSTINGEYVRRGQAHRQFMDAWILCFSNNLSASIRDELKKPAGGAIIKIRDPASLGHAIDAQMGVRGHLASIIYTDCDDRSTFVKSMGSASQREVRMAWPIREGQPQWVAIPAGTAELVDLETSPEIVVPPIVIMTGGKSLIEYYETPQGYLEINAAYGQPDARARITKRRRAAKSRLLGTIGKI